MLLGGEPMLTRIELSKLLKVHVNTVDRYVKKGMPCIKVSGAVRFIESDVMNWLKGEK